MTSFLTIEVDEFPRRDGGNLSLEFVLKVICKITFNPPAHHSPKIFYTENLFPNVID